MFKKKKKREEFFAQVRNISPFVSSGGRKVFQFGLVKTPNTFLAIHCHRLMDWAHY